MRRVAILRSIYDFTNRANPYPLYAELRKEPVSWQEDGPTEAGTFVVSTYRELVALLHPDAVMRTDGGGVVTAARKPIEGAMKRRDVLGAFAGAALSIADEVIE